MDELLKYLTHDEKVVKEAAVTVMDLKKMFDNGNITPEQFKELSEDVLEVTKIRRLNETLERKIIILQAFTELRGIVGAFIP